MTTSILTLPETLMRFASSGYTGAVLVLTLRLDSSVVPVWAAKETPKNTNAAVAAIANFFHLVDLIDTTPPQMGRSPEREKARRMPCWRGLRIIESEG